MSRVTASGGRDRRGHHQRTPWARRRRRLVTVALLGLCVLAPAILWRARLASEVRGQLAAYTARGLPVTLEALNQRLPDPPLEENAAAHYLDASRAFTWTEKLNGPGVVPAIDADVLRAGELPPASLEAMESLVAANGAVLELLHRAADFDAARYIGTYAPGSQTDTSHLEPLKSLAVLLQCQAIVAADRGETDEALQALSDMWALARSLSRDGLYISLLYRWEMEHRLLESLQWLLHRAEVGSVDVGGFMGFCAPNRRDEEIHHTLETELCLFVARIREGRRRGGVRTVLMALGVGDLNLRASLLLGDIALTWPTLPYGERKAVEQHYAKEFGERVDRRLLLATLRGNSLPFPWNFFRDRLDELRLARIGLEVYHYRQEQGAYPASLDALVPANLADPDLLLTSGEPANFVTDGGAMEIVSLREGKKPLVFRLPGG